MGYTFAPVTNRDGLIAMCVIFTVTSTTAVTLRFYSRSLVKKVRLGIDDWLAAIALVSIAYRKISVFRDHHYASNVVHGWCLFGWINNVFRI